MKSLISILSRNKIYAALTLFIILVNIAVFVEKKVPERDASTQAVTEVPEQPEVRDEAPEGKRSILDEDAEERKNRIAELAQKNPRLYLFIGLFNLLILFLIFAGFFVDVYLVGRVFNKRPLEIELNSQSPPRWGIPDVIRVVIIFLSFGYFFVIAQAFFLKLFPILNNDNFRMVFSTSVMNAVAISVICYFVIIKHGQELKDIGITARRVPAGMFYAVAGYLALLPVLLVVMVATYYVTELLKYKPPVQPIVEVFMEEKETGVLWFSTIFAAVFGPVAEEIFFRGFMYPAIRKKLGVFLGILITAAVFSLLHAHIVGFLPILALGALLAYLYEKTGSLVAPITVHIIHNLGMVMLVFIMRSLN